MVESEFSKLVMRVRFPPPACFKIMPIKTSIAKFLIRLGISADLLTSAGLAFSFGAAWLITEDRLFMAGASLLLSGLCDLMDGAVARQSGRASAFGGILDSSLDRYGDGAVLGGILIYCTGFAQIRYLLLALSALLGSFAISYVRARAECEIEDCRVGFWERGERLVLVALALLLNNLFAALWLLGLGTHWTVFQRLVCAYRKTGDKPGPVLFLFRSTRRNDWPYFLKVGALVALLLFWRPQ
jgi:phosphatidylglycerophosphate synthase